MIALLKSWTLGLIAAAALSALGVPEQTRFETGTVEVHHDQIQPAYQLSKE